MKSRKSVAWVLVMVLASAGTGLASLSEGLVAYYPFSGNADDESGNGHDGTVYGATLTSDHLGNLNSAYSFDGTDDYIRVPDSDELDLTSSFSLAFWLKPGSSSEGMVLSKHVAWTHGDGSWILLRMAESHPYYPGLLLMENWESPTAVDVYSQSAVTQDTWTHWAITYDASTHLCTFYKDGEEDATRTYTFDIRNTALDLTIGAGEHGAVPMAYWYEGSMDEICIYDRVLSAQEIATLAGVTIDAAVNIDPDTLNLNSGGKWVTCYVGLPDGYDVRDIDLDSVLLEGLLEVQRGAIRNGVLMVKFDREDLATYLEVILGVVPPAEGQLVITGSLMDGTPFEGSDTVRVIDEGNGQ